jgi:two-component system CheB/CheR fusion protein
MYTDKRFADYFGVDADAAQRGTPLSAFIDGIHPDDRPRVGAALDTVIASGDAYSEEYRVIGADGATRWLLAHGQCYLDGAGRPLRFPGVAVDTTAHHQAIEALEEADRRKDEFLAMLGHELRNPLSPILTAATILTRAESIGIPAIERARGVIERQARHLREIVDELLDVARITSGKINLKKDYVELSSAVYRAVEQTGELIEQGRHKLELTLPERPLHVIGDLPRLTQIFSNLLANAAKYTEAGGTIRLAVEPEAVVEPKAGGMWVRIRDTGIGIPPDVLPHVFDLFIQSRRALDRAQGGLGVGLTVVRRLTELHGGKVAAASGGAGQGSEFSVWLPVVAEQPGREMTQGNAVAAPARRILVVDDNRDAADMLAAVLGLEGHEVRTVYHGLEVMHMARQFAPGVILLDLGLPGKSGYELARELRADPVLGAATLIALTGYGQEEDRRQSRAHGFDHHLVKPVDFTALTRLIVQPG